MQILPSVILKNKKYRVANSNSHKIISNFDKTSLSKKLLAFLLLHKSCRVIFNGIVKTQTKSEIIMPYEVLEELPTLLEASKTSFIFSVYCKCGNILESPNLYDYNFNENFDEKDITCPKCHNKNKIKLDSYKPEFKPSYNDFYKFLTKMVEFGLLIEAPTLICNFCDTIKDLDSDKKVSFRCKTCRNICESRNTYLLPSELKDFVKAGGGYWLEWYLWKLLALRKVNVEHGLYLESKEGNRFELDIVVVHKNEYITAIECKDTNNDDNFIKKLYLIKKIVNKFALVSTIELKKDDISTVKQIMQKKLILIEPSKIEQVF